MKFRVTYEAYGVGTKGLDTDKSIPGTRAEVVFDTEQSLGKTVWEGWQSMQPTEVELTADNFRTALNTFLEFMAYGVRDNYNQVVDIKVEE